MAKVKRTYRLNEELLKELEKYAEENHVSNTQFIETAIRKAIHGPDSDNTTAILTDQLEIKDKQIADLSTALLSAQKVAEQAHVLHAVDKQELTLESPEQKSRWKRLREAWKK